MHIKRIVIEGFKSYRERTVVDPFNASHNVIVGRNGAGKSNFFAAIRFVLGDAYIALDREERQALLHEGSGGQSIISAYVEIEFDNADGRFPTGRPELILRRTVTLSRDEYTVDRKVATKSDVTSLLESAGFSRANPYYIVPQGRITTLTNAKDSERLQLLKEVAGTQVYETRRSESQKILEDTKTKRAKIEELLTHIEERLKELEEEKQELKEFQDNERLRKCLEYTIYERELHEIVSNLETIEDERVQSQNANEDTREAFIEREIRLEGLDRTLRESQEEIALLETEKAQHMEHRKQVMQSRAESEVKLSKLEFQDRSDASMAALQSELDGIQHAIDEKEKEVKQAANEYLETSRIEEQQRQRLDLCKARIDRIKDKQLRSTKFANAKERDQFLRAELRQLASGLQIKKESKETLETTLSSNQAKLECTREEIDALRAKLDSWQSTLSDKRADISSAESRYKKLEDDRRLLWREQAKLSGKLKNAQEELRDAESMLARSTNRGILQGLRTVERTVDKLGLTGVYGPMYELLEVDDRYRIPVEVVAGNSLFHVVVDNDETVTKILDQLRKENAAGVNDAGRVTFMPLNRLKPKEPQSLPNTNDAIPLIRKVKFDPRYVNAVKQVLNSAIVCPTLLIASQYARLHNLIAVTLDGDRSDQRGALTGGYHDVRRSRLEAAKRLKYWSNQFETLSSQHTQMLQDEEQLNQQITRILSTIKTMKADLLTTEDEYAPLQRKLQNHYAELNAMTDSIQLAQSTLYSVESDISNVIEQQESITSEMRQPYKGSLSDADEQQLAAFMEDVGRLTADFNEAQTARLKCETRKLTLEQEIRSNLLPQKDDLKKRLTERDVNEIVKLRDAVEQWKAQETRLAQSIAATEEKYETEISKGLELENEKAEMLQMQREDARKIERHEKAMERSVAKRSMLLQRKEACNKTIRELGVLPEEAYTKFKDLPSNTIVKRLHKIQEKLKRFSHVNKKAFEQYGKFTKQKAQLRARKRELDESQSSIDDLILVLDQRKDEAIERTFKQVSKHFAEVFEQLVPTGRGRLVIQRRIDRDDEESDDETAPVPVDHYMGVSINVSFNSKNDEQQRVQQLSGGQKSLCALTLIFAIQRCDPAPFYLFDEVDANLDAQYRSAVAQMIHVLARKAQFICTTFRPEMIQVADQFYGVTFNNKVSVVAVISKEAAMSFVDTEKPQ